MHSTIVTIEGIRLLLLRVNLVRSVLLSRSASPTWSKVHEFLPRCVCLTITTDFCPFIEWLLELISTENTSLSWSLCWMVDRWKMHMIERSCHQVEGNPLMKFLWALFDQQLLLVRFYSAVVKDGSIWWHLSKLVSMFNCDLLCFVFFFFFLVLFWRIQTKHSLKSKSQFF